MGCFLACFGFSGKRKRRKPGHKRHGSYEALDSSISIVSLGDSGVDFEARNKAKDQPSSKIRKKVSFNPNVQTYEPISPAYHLLEDEPNDAKNAEPSQESSSLNYRYRNCRDFYNEEDDIALEDSDLEDDETIDNVGDSDVESQEDGFVSGVSSSVEENGIRSVLKPVENLSQWRAAKAKEAPPKQQGRRKENVPLSRESKLPSLGNQTKPLLQEIAVDSSLSTWLNSPST